MATPLVRLAPLDLIRGFVAVGRRMSVTRAAEDLCLTQSAVSRQIHSLEDALGQSLFRRGYRSITFTPAGERLFRTADNVVRQLQDVLDTIVHPAERQPVTIAASIGVTAQWLLPRLSQLQREHPGLDVRVAPSDKRLELHTGGIDLAIVDASVADAPSGATPLFDECSVALADSSLDRHRPSGPHGYWLVVDETIATARQDVRDVAQWLADQARMSTAQTDIVAAAGSDVPPASSERKAPGTALPAATEATQASPPAPPRQFYSSSLASSLRFSRGN
jgi:DNA-binding transcriptional LysR family regulator